MNELFLFVRPPRPLWPFNGPSTAFWPPLAYASLAAALRTQLPAIKVGILDAPALKMGWASLLSEIRRLNPRYIGLGEEAVGCVDSFRIASFTKSNGAIIIAGGCFFGNVAPQVLQTGLIDVVVHGEGEQTLPELVNALRNDGRKTLDHVRGISFRDGEEVVRNEPRPLIENLDTLPFPAYDLLPFAQYGSNSKNHPALAAIELSRGCPHNCGFCILWRQMGRHAGTQLRPCFRTKSAERAFEEIRILADRFGRRYFGWVDPCFNADSKVPAHVCEMLLRSGRHVGQSAWVRADYLLRDLNSGAFDSCARAGLNELYLGIERLHEGDFPMLDRTPCDVRPALQRLSDSYPDVFTVGSFIYGIHGETGHSLRKLYRDSYDLPLDLRFFIPLTPLPGTQLWTPTLWDGSGKVFRTYDFLPHTCGDSRLAHLSLQLYWMWMFVWTWKRLCRDVASKFFMHKRRRSISWHITARNFYFVVSGLINSLLRHTQCGMRYPNWYFN
jgi:anaerobic magnesium-protoporphyrin IX monomethyl ester cyclase